MTNLLVELRLFPDADAVFLTKSAERIQQPALQVKGVLATRSLTSTWSQPDRLVLNLWGETFDLARAFTYILGAWTGVESMTATEIVAVEDMTSIGLLGEGGPQLPRPRE